MSETDVSALVRAYDEGLYTFPELAARLVNWPGTRTLDQLAGDLPGPLREKFVALMRQRYDNALAAEDFISLRGDTEMTPQRLADLRTWLSGQS